MRCASTGFSFLILIKSSSAVPKGAATLGANRYNFICSLSQPVHIIGWCGHCGARMKQGYRDWEAVSENLSTPLVKWILLSLPRSPEPWKKRTSGYFALECKAPCGVNSLYGIGSCALPVNLSESGPQHISRVYTTSHVPSNSMIAAVYRGDCARLLRWGTLQMCDSGDQHEDRP
jgi:hypothetical protein